MGQKLDLNELVVTDESGTYKFKGPNDLKNIFDGGKSWEGAKL